MAPGRDLIEVVRLSTGYLGGHGSSTPRLDAELLAAHALGLGRIDLYLQFDRRLDDDELSRVRELVRRRAGGEPVAYIVGEKEFYGRGFAVNGDVLIPRPETETLIERTLLVAGAIGGASRIADLGTGSGCIACTLAAELPQASVVAVDSSEAAVSVAEDNARRLGVIDRVEVRRGHWAADLGPVDLVVSNPPYVTTAELVGLDRDVGEHEPRAALDGGDDGLDCYRALIASLDDTPGWLGLEVDPRRAEAVVGLLRQRWPGGRTEITADLSGCSRTVEISPGERIGRGPECG